MLAREFKRWCKYNDVSQLNADAINCSARKSWHRNFVIEIHTCIVQLITFAFLCYLKQDAS